MALPPYPDDMGRLLFFLLPVFLTIFALVDCIQTDESQVKGIPKVWWILLIVFFPLVGSAAWLLAGKARQPRRNVSWPSTATSGFPEYERARPLAPDDDPEFLAQLRRNNDDHERMLRQWEDDLRKREQGLEKDDGTETPEGDAPKS